MQIPELSKRVVNALENHGYKGKFVSIERIPKRGRVHIDVIIRPIKQRASFPIPDPRLSQRYAGIAAVLCRVDQARRRTSCQFP